MGLIKDYNYIEQIGIKEKICATNMGNVIYLLNNGKKYKEFGADYYDLSDSVNVLFRDDLITQTEEYGHPLISFPEIVITNNKELYGIVGDYEIGTPISKISPLTSITKLMMYVEYLENNIEGLSLKGWNLEDMHEDNILINPRMRKKPVRVIDTDFYRFQPQRDKIELYRQNHKKIFRAVIDSVIPNLNISSIWLDDELQQNYLLASNGLMKTSDFLRFLINKLRAIYQEPKNIKTLRKTL